MNTATLSTPDEIATMQAMVAARIAEEEMGLSQPGEAPPTTQQSPLAVDISHFSGSRYLAEFPPRFNWLLEKSLRRSCLGAIVGPPGAGKGTFAIQLAVAVAAGVPFLNIWPVAAPGPALYLSAEDDTPVIHRRAYHALKQIPQEKQANAAVNFYGVAVHGQVNLCHAGRGAGVEGTTHLAALRRLLEQTKPSLLVLDTLARFSGVEENDNPAMTSFCGLLENIIAEFDCNIILLHHSNKTAGDCVEDPKELSRALTQTAMRGASALAGCIRWGLLMAPLGAGLAVKLIGDAARNRADGSFVACRVGKKNSGAPEPRHYLGRDTQGLLSKVEAAGQEHAEGETTADAYRLAEEVRRREEAREKPLAVTAGGREAFAWGMSHSKKTGEHAIELGLLNSTPKGSGNVLASKLPPITDTASNEGNNNQNSLLELSYRGDVTKGPVM